MDASAAESTPPLKQKAIGTSERSLSLRLSTSKRLVPLWPRRAVFPIG